MQNNINRAKLFNPFDALKGLQEAIKLQEKMQEFKIELGEDLESILNQKLTSIKKGDNIIVKYYHEFEYIETSGFIKKIDFIEKCIYLLSTKIYFEDILDIEINI